MSSLDTVSTLSPADMEDLFAELPVSVQQAVARGELALEDVFERITRPGLELCPHCGVREIPPRLRRVGVCSSCFAKRSVAAHAEVVADLEDKRATGMAKQRTKRLRERYGVNPRLDRDALLERAVQFLRDQLAEGPVLKPLLFERAAELGMSEAIVNAGRKRLDIQTVPGDGRSFAWLLHGELEPDLEDEEPAAPAGPDTARAEDYGRGEMITTSEHRLLTRCLCCGRVTVDHRDDDNLCPYCREKVSSR